jgi:hypothetical protein
VLDESLLNVVCSSHFTLHKNTRYCIFWLFLFC